MAGKTKTIYICNLCGYESAKWYGCCPGCGEWNCMEEDIRTPAQQKTASRPVKSVFAQTVNEIDGEDEIRFKTGMQELDRVLGGGIVKGSLVLLSGDPGIGKSTILLQICEYLGKNLRVLYVSGEESARQIKLRAKRLGVSTENLFIMCQTDVQSIVEYIKTDKPDLVIVDSIQTIYTDESDSAPGSVSQVKECTMSLMHLAKANGITVFVVGHINKDGAIAGPKVLEHMVDCVLYFEGDLNSTYRLLRAAKNRFGSTNEIGVFEMENNGLVEVPNPSQMLLQGRPKGAPGTCVVCLMEGTRPILAEVQALVTKTSFNVPRRTADGFDYNRAALLMAVAEKRANMILSAYDAYINVIGGLQINETGADLAVVLALASSFRDKAIADDLVAIGEVGLTGEIRTVSNMSQRLSEIARLGFKRCIIPETSIKKFDIPGNLEIYYVKNLRDAIEIAL